MERIEKLDKIDIFQEIESFKYNKSSFAWSEQMHLTQFQLKPVHHPTTTHYVPTTMIFFQFLNLKNSLPLLVLFIYIPSPWNALSTPVPLQSFLQEACPEPLI